MEISEVKVKLMGGRSNRLKAFCSITMDREFVIRDLKVIEGTGGIFVAMPSRKITDRCPACRSKNHLRAKFCNECGGRLNQDRASKDPSGRSKLHADIAHPINSGCRDRMQMKIVKAYEEEVLRSQTPGYRPAREEDFDDIDYVESEVPQGGYPFGGSPAASRQDGSGEGAASDGAQKGADDAFGAGIL